jgi:hypothetical protein
VYKGCTERNEVEASQKIVIFCTFFFLVAKTAYFPYWYQKRGPEN